jgi:hypothetical protein
VTDQYTVKSGGLFQLLPISSQLYEALLRQGMAKPLACWWILRQSIVLGGGESGPSGCYDKARKMLQEILKGGDD